MDTAHKYTRDAAAAESKRDTQRMCEASYAALMLLDKYKQGEWRANYKPIAEKVDRQYDEIHARFIKIPCPQMITVSPSGEPR
jgi:hypothetical protein